MIMICRRETGGPPRTTFFMLNYYPTLLKMFLGRLSVFVDLTKNNLGRIILRPNIQALEKNVAKNAISILLFLVWPEMTKIFQKSFGGYLRPTFHV